MIIKKEEWDKISKSLDMSREKNNRLEDRIKFLENSRKSDEIKISTCISSPYCKNVWYIDSSKDLDLSSGIKRQILRLLSQISDKVQSTFNSTIEPEVEKRIAAIIQKEKYTSYSKLFYFYKKLASLPWYTPKKKIVKLFKNELL
jgi:hypothetical protein